MGLHYVLTVTYLNRLIDQLLKRASARQAGSHQTGTCYQTGESIKDRGSKKERDTGQGERGQCVGDWLQVVSRLVLALCLRVSPGADMKESMSECRRMQCNIVSVKCLLTERSAHRLHPVHH